MTEPIETKKKHVRPWWRWLIWIFIAVLLLPVIILLLLQLNSVQNYLKGLGEHYLQKKLHTKVHIGYLRARGWQYLELRKVFVADTSNKTLFYTGSLKIHYNLLSFFNNELTIHKLEWDTLLINVYRHKNDSTFNYQFVVDAFTSKNTVPDTIAPTGTKLQYRLKNISLARTKVSFVDIPGGSSAVLTWNKLQIDPDELLVDDGVYAFRQLQLDGLAGFFHQKYIPAAVSNTAPPPRKDTNSTALHLLLKKLQINNSRFLYSDESSGITTGWLIGKLLLHNTTLDQDITRIQVENLNISHTNGMLMMLPGKDTIHAVKDTTPNTWQVLAAQVNLNQLSFRYDNGGPASKNTRSTPDYNHLMLTHFSSNLNNITYKPDSILVKLKSLTVHERSGFAIRKATMDLLFTPQTLALRNFLLQTNKSVLRNQVIVNVPSWSGISNNLERIELDTNLDSLYITLGEWLPFVPNARKNKAFASLWNKKLTLTTTLKGSLGDLKIKQLYLNDFDGNLVKVQNAQIAHVTDANRLTASLPNLFIQSGNKPVRSWLPAATLPDSVRLPEQIIISGMFNGGMKNMIARLQLKSNYANAAINARLMDITDSIKSRYAINIPYFRANPGMILSNKTYGWISGKIIANGYGYTLKQMTAQTSIQLNDATYNAYTYKDINLSAAINKGHFKSQGESADTNITVSFDMDGKLADSSIQALTLNVDLVKADLFTTHWYTEPLTLKGNLAADFNYIEPQRIAGSTLLTNGKVAIKGQIIPLDTISLLAQYDDQQYITFKSPLGVINANGHMNYTKLGDAFSRIISKPLMPADSGRIVKIPAEQSLQWSASLVWPRNLQPFFPNLRTELPLTITGRLNSDSSLFIMNAAIPKLRYESFQIDSFQVSVNIRDTALRTNASLARMEYPTFPLYHTFLTADANMGVVHLNLLLDDEQGHPKYKLGSTLSFLDDNTTQLSLLPELLLNKQQWSVAANNILRIKKGILDTVNINLSQSKQFIQITSAADTGRVPALQANIANFQLSTITGLMATDTLLANGNMNATATIRNYNTSPEIHATLKVDTLTVKNTRLGNLDAGLQTNGPSFYKFSAGLTGNNDIKVNGTYDSTLNALLNINNLNMAALEPFTMGNVSRMSGNATGKFDISGTAKAPKIRGNLHFNDASGMVNFIGSTLYLPDEDIVIDDKGILFNNLVITDSLKNELVINGRINTPDFQKYNFNLDVRADNFMALGKQQNPDQWVYGPAFIDSKIKVRGSMDLPRVDAFVKLRDKSSITVLIPEEKPGLTDREGVVEFVDKSNPEITALLNKQDSLKYQNPRLKGMVFSGNLEITPESIIKIVIDRQNGDFIQAKGTASLNATLDPSSKMSLTGRYEITEGKYEMSLNQLIKRSFNIEKGSFISFNGDATSADLNITAKYTANAPAYDLVADQLQNLSPADRNRYKQRLPFEVYLMIKGSLLKPDISFRLDMPEKERNALGGSPYNRLKQINQVTSELNKQVMGLLILNSFIPDNPMSSLDAGGGGGGIGLTAKNSVSKILSQQLNNLAGNLIKGVDINFDLQNREDYSTGTAQQTTNLNIGASKRLFSERLTVSVGSNIMLQGNQQNASSMVGDISIEYKLSRDGRYRIRIYQRNDNQTVIEGQIVETGVAFMLIMDYDEFKEILQSSKKEETRQRLRNNKKMKDKRR